MKHLCRAGALVLALGAMCAWPAAARADPAVVARDVVVVDVDARADVLDAARLREAIGEELGADAVAPGDARATGARGVVAVSIDRAARTLVVSYREKAAPIVRTIDLPGDPGAILRAAVLLAGNLARDEASELAQMLRRKAPGSDAAAPGAAAAGAADPELESDDSDSDPTADRDVERLGLTLSRYADHRRTPRTAFAWTGTGVALAMEGAGLYLSTQGRGDAGLVLVETGFGVMLIGMQAAPSGRLDVLRRYYDRDRASGRPSWMVRDDLESMWLSSARSERKWRLTLGWVDVAVAGTELVSFGLLGAAAKSMEIALGSFYVGFAGSFLGTGIIMLSGPGDAEASLRSYERATGRHVWRDRAAPVAPVLSPTPGGGVVGLVGRF